MKYNNIEELLNNVLEIRSNNFIYDLRNDAELDKIEYNIGKNYLIITWKYPSKWFSNESHFKSDKLYKSKHDIKDLDSYIIFQYENIKYLRIKGIDLNIRDFILEDIRTYIEYENNDIIDNGNTLIFQNDFEISILADVLTLIII